MNLLNFLVWLKNKILGLFRRDIMGRVVIEISEIIAGRGLFSNGQTVPSSIEVKCGNGIKFGDNDDVAVNNGNGLAFSDSGELQIANEYLAGKGLVATNIGCQIDVDTTVDPQMQQSFQVLANATFQMDGYVLVFLTKHTTYLIDRNSAGVVLSIREGESVTEKQPLNINGYGYGSVGNETESPPKIDSKLSFYK